MYHSKVGMDELMQDQYGGMDEDDCGMYDQTEDGGEEPTEPGGLTQTQKDNIRDIYNKIDKNQSGDLSMLELRKGLQLLGLNPTVKDTRAIVKKHNVEGKTVSYEEFERIMAGEVLSLATQEVDLLEAFRLFDKDKSGTLDKGELKKCLQCLGEKLTDEEVDELFDTLDTDKNGVLSIVEASKLLA